MWSSVLSEEAGVLHHRKAAVLRVSIGRGRVAGARRGERALAEGGQADEMWKGVLRGSARLVEKLFNSKEDELLYVGDHLFHGRQCGKSIDALADRARRARTRSGDKRAAATETRRTAQIDALLGERDNLRVGAKM